MALVDGRIVTEIRKSDGYVNATKMCQEAGREWKTYHRSNKEFIEEVSRSVQNCTDLLIQQTTTGPNEDRGTWVHHQVAIHLAMWCSPVFAVAVTDLVTRYLTGRVTTEESQEAARRLNEHVNPRLQLKSSTNQIDFDKPQLYLRWIPGPWRDVHPIGRPELALSQEELIQAAIVKLGSQGPYTGRQQAHTYAYPDSRLLDSFVTDDYKTAERNMKRRLRNELSLFEGTYGDNTKRDTELIVIRSQEDYDACVGTIRDVILVRDDDTISSLQLECDREKTKQTEIIEKEKTKQMEIIEKTKQMQIQLEMRKLDLEEKRLMMGKTKATSEPLVAYTQYEIRCIRCDTSFANVQNYKRHIERDQLCDPVDVTRSRLKTADLLCHCKSVDRMINRSMTS